MLSLARTPCQSTILSYSHTPQPELSHSNFFTKGEVCGASNQCAELPARVHVMWEMIKQKKVATFKNTQ